jgi:hypothetical protein
VHSFLFKGRLQNLLPKAASFAANALKEITHALNNPL